MFLTIKEILVLCVYRNIRLNVEMFPKKNARQFKSPATSSMGVEWYLSVFVMTNENDKDNDDYLSIYLHATPMSKNR